MRQRDDAGFIGDLLAEPAGADEEAADEEAEDADGAGRGEGGGEIEVEAADEAVGGEEADAEADGAVIERDEGEGAESPEDEGVGEAGEGPLADDFGLAEDFEKKSRMRGADGEEMEAGVFFGFENLAKDTPKRRQKAYADAKARAAKSSFSAREKCWGSARVGSMNVINEPDKYTGLGILGLPPRRTSRRIWGRPAGDDEQPQVPIRFRSGQAFDSSPRRLAEDDNSYSVRIAPYCAGPTRGSAVDDVGGVDAFGGVSGVDDKLRLGHDCGVVVARVVGDDEDRVVLAEIFERGVGHVEVVVAATANSRECRGRYRRRWRPFRAGAR